MADIQRRRALALAFGGVLVIGVGLALALLGRGTPHFDGQRALAHAAYQMELGPRTPGSDPHQQARAYFVETLREYGWEVEEPYGVMLGQPIYNVVAKRGSGRAWVILGAHYDSRFYADQDALPQNRLLPVPGANDGASGVAVLLELARVLPADLPGEVWLAFFDAEDNGGIQGWDWILGSRLLADSLAGQPDAVIILDMIGDADLNIYLESNSDAELAAGIWAQAAALGHEDVFINSPKYSMLDDHTPFLQLGIPAVDIIDFDYPYWHTREDTLDKISAQSLQIVGETVLAWLLGFIDT